MKILSAHIRNYRTHCDTTVRLGDGPILVHGPNESGKSTLVEAVHAALFLRATGNTELHARMRSTFGGNPEVRIEFETAGGRHVLTKTFGPSGKTVLTCEGKATLTGDTAEEHLAKLLGVDGSVQGRGAAKALPLRWAHLWVWQGQSSGSPLESLAEAEARLHAKLQSESGQTVLSSPLDNVVLGRLQSLVDTTLTGSGQAKAGSDLKKAEQELEEARRDVESKRDSVERLRQAADAYTQAEADLERFCKSLLAAEARLREIREKLDAVRTQREALKEKTRERETLEKEQEKRTKDDAEIRGLETKLDAARKEAAPSGAHLARLEADLKEAKAAFDAATRARETATADLNKLRAILDARQAHIAALDAARRMRSSEATAQKIDALRAEEAKLRERLAPLAPFTEKAVKTLRSRHSTALEARAKLEAYALSVECIESDRPVTIDGTPLEPGSQSTLARSADLCIGDGTRIRLSPGGAEDLRLARDASEKGDVQLAEALRGLAVSSLDEAVDRCAERDAVERELKSLRKNLKEADSDGIEKALSEARETYAREGARRDALSVDNAYSFPEDPGEAQRSVAEAADTLRGASGQADAAASGEKVARNLLAKREAAFEDARKTHQERLDTLRTLETQWQVRLQQTGDADARAKALNELQARLDRAKAAEADARESLAQLGPDRLETEQARLQESLKRDGENRANAHDRKITAQAELRSSGASDPESDAKEAEARCGQAERRHAALRHQADVRLHLLERFKAARQAATAELARPLEEAVAPYLHLLFGGSRVRLHWDADGGRLESFEIDRTSAGGDCHRFEALSHGTREQTALALRLAMAEILAGDYDGCLPVVLDDAFTHADHERIECLKSLLFRASQQGLQIILLTCHPENYSGLGAAEVSLVAAKGGASPVAGQPPPDTAGDVVPNPRPVLS